MPVIGCLLSLHAGVSASTELREAGMTIEPWAPARVTSAASVAEARQERSMLVLAGPVDSEDAIGARIAVAPLGQ